MDIKKLILDVSIRGDCYRLLAACFYYPSKEVFIQGNLFKKLTESFKKISSPAAEFSEEMEKAFSYYSNEDLLVDYSKLFVGPNELVAPPYGSVYLDKGRRVMGVSTMEVVNIYRTQGLGMDEDFREMPDHIAVELEFMSFLIHEEIKALENDDLETARKFMEKQNMFLHFYLSWVPLLCEKIKKGTDNSFYVALADCLQAFVVNFEDRRIGNAVSSSRSLHQYLDGKSGKAAK